MRIDSLILGEFLPKQATKTWDGSIEPAVQAEPPETAKPAKSKFVCKTVVETPLKCKFNT